MVAPALTGDFDAATARYRTAIDDDAYERGLPGSYFDAGSVLACLLDDAGYAEESNQIFAELRNSLKSAPSGGGAPVGGPEAVALGLACAGRVAEASEIARIQAGSDRMGIAVAIADQLLVRDDAEAAYEMLGAHEEALHDFDNAEDRRDFDFAELAALTTASHRFAEKGDLAVVNAALTRAGAARACKLAVDIRTGHMVVTGTDSGATTCQYSDFVPEPYTVIPWRLLLEPAGDPWSETGVHIGPPLDLSTRPDLVDVAVRMADADVALLEHSLLQRTVPFDDEPSSLRRGIEEMNDLGLLLVVLARTLSMV